MYKKLAITAAVWVVTIGLAGGAARAQIPAIFYSGTQSAIGTSDPVTGFVYGNMFVLNSTGEWDSRYLTVSINYRKMFRGIAITGGAWSLAVFSDGVYLGTVYGDVISGDILFAVNGSGKLVSKQTRMGLRATGGTGIFEARRDKNINGTIDMITDLRTFETMGTASMNF